MLGLEQRNEPRRDEGLVFMGELGAPVALFQAATGSPQRAEGSTGLRHLAFAVARDDLDRAQEHLRELGVDFRCEDHGSALGVRLRPGRQRRRADELRG